ncbi:leukocyte receptor cluster member 1 [Octopus sinensis]|uniref:Leukocyte receptor cluster member 1 n=1 Tax=Octopus sinensis TaxID=2607531 RepID=A0A6P7TPH4_9MOLL|nr:leukocyte receptor cluster member 1 [Octopus sinensis]
MNILPHKSWHVRTKKNIERVRRDEEKAAEEEKEKQRRVALAEQEARTEILRAKVRQKGIEENPENTVSEAVPGQRHINFFSAIQNEEESSNRKNKEHEAEEKSKKEEWEKKIGLLTYLGQSAVESQTVPPWYLDKKLKKQEAICSDKKQKLSDLADPLHEMEKYLKHKHHKKHKHDKKKNKKSKTKSSSSSSSKSSLEQLRAERLRRENKEKEKAKMLFAKMNKGSVPEKSSETIVDPDRDRRYSSQYNPSFARQNKPRN